VSEDAPPSLVDVPVASIRHPEAVGDAQDAPVEAGVVCVNVDLSTYDRSCTTESDCVYIAAGTLCSDQCVATCGNVYVNVDGLDRYRQTVTPLPQQPVCNCPAQSLPSCVQGQCTASSMSPPPPPPLR
jgi:hypothetical protein